MHLKMWVLIGALMASPLAIADHGGETSVSGGNDLVFNPGPGFGISSVTETLGGLECDDPSDSQFNGIDGGWVAIPDEYQATIDPDTGEITDQHQITMTLVENPAYDADAWFYTEDCTFGDSGNCEAGGTCGANGFLGETEFAPIPPGAAYIFVSSFAGFGSWTITFQNCPVDPDTLERACQD